MSVEQEGLNLCLWVPALAVGRWGTFGCTAPRYRHKRRSGIKSMYVCGEYRELCCHNIVGVDEGSVVDSGSGGWG